MLILFENWRQFPLSVPGFHFGKPSALRLELKSGADFYGAKIQFRVRLNFRGPILINLKSRISCHVDSIKRSTGPPISTADVVRIERAKTY